MLDIENITPDNYIVPKGEERSYHCKIEVMEYDRKTGKKVSKPRIQKFGQKMFESFIYSNLKKQGYIVTILHDPKEWLKKQMENAKKQAEQAENAKKQAENANNAEGGNQDAGAGNEAGKSGKGGNKGGNKGGRPAKGSK